MPDSPAPHSTSSQDLPAAVKRPAGMRQRLAAIGIGATLTLAVAAGVAFVTSIGSDTLPTHPSMLTPVARPVSGPPGARYCHWRPYGWFCSSTPTGPLYPLGPQGMGARRATPKRTAKA